MLCLSSKALYRWTTKQVSLRFTCSIFWELFRNSRTKCPHIQQLLNHKTIKSLRPWFFCVSTFPEIKEYKISVPVTLNKEIKKLPFLPSKMGVDLYMGKYSISSSFFFCPHSVNLPITAKSVVKDFSFTNAVTRESARLITWSSPFARVVRMTNNSFKRRALFLLFAVNNQSCSHGHRVFSNATAWGKGKGKGTRYLTSEVPLLSREYSPRKPTVRSFYPPLSISAQF